MYSKSHLTLAFLCFCSLLSTIAGLTYIWQRMDILESQLTANVSADFPQSVLPTSDPQIVELQMSNSNLESRLASAEAKLASIKTSAINPTVPSKPATTQPREYVIYLGTGTTHQRDWTNIAAAGVTFDPSKYQHIREVRFEASLSIINGEVYARLYDQLTGQPFYSTEVSNNTQTGVWKLSTPITLPADSRYYSVQLRSSSGEQAELSGARLRILAD